MSGMNLFDFLGLTLIILCLAIFCLTHALAFRWGFRTGQESEKRVAEAARTRYAASRRPDTS